MSLALFFLAAKYITMAPPLPFKDRLDSTQLAQRLEHVFESFKHIFISRSLTKGREQGK